MSEGKGSLADELRDLLRALGEFQGELQRRTLRVATLLDRLEADSVNLVEDVTTALGVASQEKVAGLAINRLLPNLTFALPTEAEPGFVSLHVLEESRLSIEMLEPLEWLALQVRDFVTPGTAGLLIEIDVVGSDQPLRVEGFIRATADDGFHDGPIARAPVEPGTPALLRVMAVEEGEDTVLEAIIYFPEPPPRLIVNSLRLWKY